MNKITCICAVALVVASATGLAPGLVMSQPLRGLPESMVVYVWLTEPDGTQYAGARSGEGVYRSSNNGALWDGFGNGLGSSSVFGIVSRSSSGDLLAGTWGQGVYRRRASDGSWSAFRQGILSNFGYIRAMETHPNGTIYAGDDERVVYELRPGESSWRNVSANLPSAGSGALRTLAVDGSGRLCAGLDNGVWEYVGSAWQPRGSLASVVNMLDVAPDGGALWAGTSSGVYRWNGTTWLLERGDWDVTALRIGPFATLVVGLRSGQVYYKSLPNGGWSEVPIANAGRVWSLGFAADGRLYVGSDRGWASAVIVYPAPTPTPTYTPRPEIKLTLANAPSWTTPVPNGALISYSITYQNPGVDAVEGITLTGWIPLHTAYDPDSATAGGQRKTLGEREYIQWHVPLAQGQQAMPTLHYRVRVNWPAVPAMTPTVPRVLTNYAEARWESAGGGSTSSNFVYNGVGQVPPNLRLPYILKSGPGRTQ